jgi:hypothetical protein
VNKTLRAAINRAADRFARWAESLYPEHRWVRDEEGLLYCAVCWLPYARWSGEPCPDEDRVNLWARMT